MFSRSLPDFEDVVNYHGFGSRGLAPHPQMPTADMLSLHHDTEGAAAPTTVGPRGDSGHHRALTTSLMAKPS